MENDTTNNQPPISTPTPPPVPEPTPVAPSPLKTATMIPSVSVPKPKNWLPFVIGAAVIGLLLIIIIAISVGLSLLRSVLNYTPPPPAPAAAPVVNIVPVSSKYASDAGVLKLRDDLRVIAKAIDSIDLVEPQIAPPALDLRISIEPQK